MQLLRNRQQRHESPNAQKVGTPGRSGAASPGAQLAEALWERGASRERRKSERIIKSHHTHKSLGALRRLRWRPTWRVRSRGGCFECV
jgi:hypothetical protein